MNIEEVIIGNQIWSKQNADISFFRNGDKIPSADIYSDWSRIHDDRGPGTCFYGGDEKNGSKYGKLYNWFVITDSRGFAPEGWHIPSDDEWKTLINYLGGKELSSNKLKSNYDWSNHSANQSGNGTDSSGFTGLPGSYRTPDGAFRFDLGTYGYWWSSTEGSSYNAWGYSLGCNFKEIDRFCYSLRSYLSVRFIKN